MVTPAEIKEKSERLYLKFVRARLMGDDFFPRTVPCNKDVPGDICEAREMKLQIEAESHETRGYGYTVQWKTINRPGLGRNRWPGRIFFASETDFLRYLGKEREFKILLEAAERVRIRFPPLSDWLERHPKRLIAVAGKVEELLAVVQYLSSESSARCFLREIPGVHSKFAERHKAVLRDWLEVILPDDRIFPDERFERRFGLKYKNDYVIVRFLDPQLQQQLGIPFDDLKLPLETLKELHPGAAQLFVVENEIPLRSLPSLRRTIAVGGLGDAVTLLTDLGWAESLQITYWGDLDVEGFEALASFRARFPQTRSFMMDDETLHRFENRAGDGNSALSAPPPQLEPAEVAAFQRCAEEAKRLEQEHIPHEAVLSALSTW